MNMNWIVVKVLILLNHLSLQALGTCLPPQDCITEKLD